MKAKRNIIIYNLILNYAVNQIDLNSIFMKDFDYRAIKKDSNSILDSIKRGFTHAQKGELMRTLISIDKQSKDLKRLSNEMLVIIAIDWLVNVERDLLSRSKFGHLNLTFAIDKIMINYKDDMKNHLKFFESIVDVVKN